MTSGQQLEMIRVAPHLTEDIPYPVRAFVPTLSIPLPEEVERRLAASLKLAVEKIQGTIRRWFMVRILFGSPPYFGHPNAAGVEWFVADMTQDPIGTAVGQAIYLDAYRLAAMPTEPIDLAALSILEELVHTFLNIQDEDIARWVTARLLGGVRTEGEQYLPLEQADN